MPNRSLICGSGKLAREKFERTMTALFRVPKKNPAGKSQRVVPASKGDSRGSLPDAKVSRHDGE